MKQSPRKKVFGNKVKQIILTSNKRVRNNTKSEERKSLKIKSKLFSYPDFLSANHNEAANKVQGNNAFGHGKKVREN